MPKLPPPSLAIPACVMFGLIMFAALPGARAESASLGDSEECLEIFISPAGNDTWSGRSLDHVAGADGPLRSLQAALKRVRELRAHPTDSSICISLRAGTYPLTRTLEIGVAETGAEGARTIIRTHKGEQVILSGGIVLMPPVSLSNGRYAFDLDGVCDNLHQRALFINGKRRARSRTPKSGYFEIDREFPRRRVAGKPRDSFGVGAELDERHRVINGESEVVALHYWSASRFGIFAYDPAERKLTVDGITSYPDVWARLGKGGRYFYENIDSSDLAPGEWYQHGSRLEYLPTIDEVESFAKAQAEAVFPCLPVLIAITEGAQNVRFEGIRFQFAGDVGSGYHRSPAQADIGPDTSSSIQVTAAHDIVFSEIEISHVADYAIQFDPRVKRGKLTESELADLGGGGVIIGDPSNAYTRRTGTAQDVQTGNEIRNTLIHQGGRIRSDAVAIWIGDVGGNSIAGNNIQDFDYTGISVGWTWGGWKLSRNNRIEGNIISNIGRSVLSDLGGIYTLADLTGTIISNNIIRDVKAARYGGFGIYLDRGSTGALVESNRIENATQAGIALHFAQQNTIRGNDVALAEGLPSLLVIKPGTAPNDIKANSFNRTPQQK
jgi:parallel beta-helix repeat protein